VSLPRIRSERPAFDLHHPEVLGFVLLVMAIVGLVFENYFGESYEA
jgi:hypothetical protein